TKDTCAWGNSDLERRMKTSARFAQVPSTARAGEPITVTGLAQVGVSGLAKVQYSLHPADMPLHPDDPHLRRGDWQDADILPPPERWGGGLPGGRLPSTPLQ